MRLIDIDKISKDTEMYYGGFTSYSSAMIEEAEIVKAIPIEWIEKWFSQFYGEQGLEWNRCKRFMLEDWEKENEAN